MAEAMDDATAVVEEVRDDTIVPVGLYYSPLTRYQALSGAFSSQGLPAPAPSSYAGFCTLSCRSLPLSV